MKLTFAFLLKCGLVFCIQAVVSSKSLCPRSLETNVFWHPYEDQLSSDNNGTVKGKLRDFLEKSLKSCCPNMAAPNYLEILKKHSKNMENLIRADEGGKEISMYFPVFGNRESLVHYERHFIGLYDSPGIVVFVPAKNERMWNGLLAIGTQLWQVITLAFLLAAISGILVWFLDRKANNGDFPKDFQHGSCAGLWWAFVTMSTVGYGDLVPRTFLSRVVSVLWMIVGYLTLAMFHANLTALITSKEIPMEVSLVGEKIYIPRGGKSFLEEELNLLADYEEIEFKDMSVNRIFAQKENAMFLSYNYAELKLALRYRTTIRPKDTVKVLKNINHRFSVGISLSGNVSDSEDIHFITCLRRTLRDKVILDKHKTYLTLQGFLDTKKHSSLSSSSSSSPFDFEWSGWMIGIVSSGALLALMIAVGMVHQLCHSRNYQLHGRFSTRKSLQQQSRRYFRDESDHEKRSTKC